MPNFAILAASPDRRDALKQLVSTAFSLTQPDTQVVGSSLPVDAADGIIANLKERRPDVVLVDIPPSSHSAGPALWAIETVHAEIPHACVFALGDLSQAQTVVDAMRAGAYEFLPSECTADQLLSSVAQLPRREQTPGAKGGGRVITVINAKGGCGATTVAVNLGVALDKGFGRTVIVDMAPLGHTALHLNAQPSFGIATALRSLHRLDQSLLEGLLTTTECGVDLLASMEPLADESFSAEGLRHLLELFAERYQYVVIDASSRLDPLVRELCEMSDLVLLVAECHTLALLWSAARVQRYLAGERQRYDKVHLVLNRYVRDFPLSDTDTEAATDARVLWKIPSEGMVVGPSIDSGVPIVLKKNSVAGHSLKDLAGAVVDLLHSGHRLSSGVADTSSLSFLSSLAR